MHAEYLQCSSEELVELLDVRKEQDGTYTVLAKKEDVFLVADDAKISNNRLHFLFGSIYKDEKAARHDFAAKPTKAIELPKQISIKKQVKR